jgi:purine nucleoside phosphorylase
MEKIKSAVYLLEEANKTLDQNAFYDWVLANIKLLKAMEKEQIVVANKVGWMQVLDGEDYYNQTYNQNIN